MRDLLNRVVPQLTSLCSLRTAEETNFWEKLLTRTQSRHVLLPNENKNTVRGIAVRHSLILCFLLQKVWLNRKGLTIGGNCKG